MIDHLTRLGWDDFFAQQFTELATAWQSAGAQQKLLVPARIVEPLRGLSRAICPLGELWAEMTEKSAKQAALAVGDWVLGTLRDHAGTEKRMDVTHTLQRKNQLSRTAPGGKNYEQVLCANVDIAFLVLAGNQVLSLPGVERYLRIFRENALAPVLVVTKADAVEATEATVAALKTVAKQVPIHPISILEHQGAETLLDYFEGTKTIVLLGASGAGKSTLTNFLIGSQSQRTSEVRESDQKGRHTTTGRRLHFVHGGGMVIDSPGMRELQPWVPPPPPIEVVKQKKKGKPKSFHGARNRYGDDD